MFIDQQAEQRRSSEVSFWRGWMGREGEALNLRIRRGKH